MQLRRLYVPAKKQRSLDEDGRKSINFQHWWRISKYKLTWNSRPQTDKVTSLNFWLSNKEPKSSERRHSGTLNCTALLCPEMLMESATTLTWKAKPSKSDKLASFRNDWNKIVAKRVISNPRWPPLPVNPRANRCKTARSATRQIRTHLQFANIWKWNIFFLNPTVVSIFSGSLVGSYSTIFRIIVGHQAHSFCTTPLCDGEWFPFTRCTRDISEMANRK